MIFSPEQLASDLDILSQESYQTSNRQLFSDSESQCSIYLSLQGSNYRNGLITQSHVVEDEKPKIVAEHMDEEKSQTFFANHQNQAQGSEYESESHSESEFQLSVFSYHYETNPKSAEVQIQVQPLNRSFQQIRFPKEEGLVSILNQFLINIEQQQGLLLSEKLRTKLNHEGVIPPGYKCFDSQHQKFEEEEHSKIFPIVKNLLIFDRRNHNTDKSQQEFIQFNWGDVKVMVDLFYESASTLCREVTAEFYHILATICNLVVMFRNQESESFEESQDFLREVLRRFGRGIMTGESMDFEYFFFNWKFADFQGKRLANGEIKVRREDREWALKPQFREGKEMGEFAEKAGMYFLMYQLPGLRCFWSLK